MIKVSDYIARRLKEHYGVSTVFLITGGGAMHLNDSFGKYIPYITAHNEQALAIMGEGYARVEQKLAVVNVTTGPGGANCINGLLGQWTDSVPVLYLSGQVKFPTTLASCPELALRQLGDQEIAIINIVQPLTKYAVMVTDPYSIKYHLDKAIYEAVHGRMGPVWLDIPLDVQGVMIDETLLEEFTPAPPPLYSTQIDAVIEKLQNAKRPLIIAGQGIRLSGKLNTLYDLLKKLAIPVVTTFCGMDQIPYSHPNFVGRIGANGQRAGNFALQNADCVLCLGTRNSIFQVSYAYENFAKNAYTIAVDIDEAELCKPTVKLDMKICADISAFLPELYEKTHQIERKEWLEWCIARKEQYSFAHVEEYTQQGDTINAYFFVKSLISSLHKNTIMVTANGSACVLPYQVGENTLDQRIFWNKGSASMGYGLPASIGACVYAPDRPIVCLEGDGSIMMNIQELQTIKEYNLPIKIFILNNDGYISIKQTQTNLFDKNFVGCGRTSCVSMPNFSHLAEAFGLQTKTISSPHNLQEQIDAVLCEEGAVVCDVHVNPEYIFSPKLGVRRLEDGTLVSPSLEDMAPFLPREEYNNNIIG